MVIAVGSQQEAAGFESTIWGSPVSECACSLWALQLSPIQFLQLG